MKNWPHGIYLESSVLRTLPLQVVVAEVERLQELAGLFAASIYIPDVCYLEWIRHRRGDLQKFLAQTDQLSRTFGYNAEGWPAERQRMVDELDKKTREILAGKNIQILPTPEISLQRLIDMAVNKKRPFEEKGEKGFRDSVILFTVLEHAKMFPKKSHLLVTKDNVYQHRDVTETASQYGVEMVCATSLLGAVEDLERFGERVGKAIEEYDRQVLHDFLEGTTEEITNYVRANCEFTESWLNENVGVGFLSRVLEVKDASVVGIASVTRGTVPYELEEGQIKISFAAKTKLTVRILPSFIAPNPKHKVGGVRSDPFGVSSGGLLLGTSLPPVEEKTEEVELPVEATVFLRRERGTAGRVDKYSNLKIEGVSI